MSLAIAIGGLSLLMIAGARFLPLDRVAASTAIVVWFCVLAVGAIATVSAAIFAIIYLPGTAIYSFLAGLCVHVAIPVISPHLGISGHTALHLLMALPVAGLFASTLWLISRLSTGWWTLRSRLKKSIETDDGWTLIRDDGMVMGVAPIGQSRIVVSDTTLRAMDDEELEAGLNHEAGHLRRGHRSIVLVARVLAALGFAFPGTRRAQSNLHLALERDADEYAVRQTRDPLSLASAICKAAIGPLSAGEIGLAGARVNRRLDYLEGRLTLAGPTVRRSMHVVAMIFVAATLVFASATTTWAAGAPAGNHAWSISSTDC
jgi:hypothetical protein